MPAGLGLLARPAVPRIARGPVGVARECMLILSLPPYGLTRCSAASFDRSSVPTSWPNMRLSRPLLAAPAPLRIDLGPVGLEAVSSNSPVQADRSRKVQTYTLLSAFSPIPPISSSPVAASVAWATCSDVAIGASCPPFFRNSTC
jgi:hypothetical protein